MDRTTKLVLDLSLYLCPASPISPYMLNSGENCYSFLDPKGYGRFLKNQHHETIWFDENYILRGLDTSNLPNEVYAQYTGERYGAIWSKRFVNVGDYTERNPDIRHYDANGKHLRTASGGVSYLHVVKHYDSLAFPETGQTVKDVVELTWTFDAQGKNIIERYWYARGLALVGFSYYGNPPLHTRYSGLTSVKPTFHPLPNFAEPLPPPVEKEPPPMPTPIPAAGGVKGVIVSLPGVKLRNIRAQSKATDAASDVGDLMAGDRVTAFIDAKDAPPDWTYIERMSDGVKGWVFWVGIEFAPELLPEPAPSKDVIYTEAQVSAIREHLDSLRGHLIEISSLLDKGAPTNSGGGF